jgi:hypothetical protein
VANSREETLSQQKNRILTDKERFEHRRSIRRIARAGLVAFCLLFLCVVGVIAYQLFTSLDNHQPFREPVVVPIDTADLSRMV